MKCQFLVALFFTSLISLFAQADSTLISKGPYLSIEKGNVVVYKINKSGQLETSKYNLPNGKFEIQRIENEVAFQSEERGSFHTSSNEAIVDFISMKDGYTYGTMFGPPGEELFVIETSKFKARGQMTYEAFKSLCDHVAFIALTTN